MKFLLCYIWVNEKLIIPIKKYITTPASSTTGFLRYLPDEEVLVIGFRTGNIYHYRKVSALIWKQYADFVLNGGSSGSFFNKHIKDKYDFEEVL